MAGTSGALEATAAELRQLPGAKDHRGGGRCRHSLPAKSALLAAASDPDILVNNNAGTAVPRFQTAHTTADDRWRRCQHGGRHRAHPEGDRSDGGTKIGRIVNITSGSVKMPLSGLNLSSGARAGLTAFLAGVARSVAAQNVTINFLLPGAFETDRLRTNIETPPRTRASASSRRNRAHGEVPAKRIGDPEEFGAACAFPCSAQAGYITGQNILIDGGAFPGGF